MKFHAFVIVGETDDGQFFSLASESTGAFKMATVMGSRINTNTHNINLKFEPGYGLKIVYYPDGTPLEDVLELELGYFDEEEESDEDDDEY